jgi:hypothetical protein
MLMRRFVPLAMLCAAVTVAAAELAIQAPADPASTRFAVIGDTGTGDKYENDVAQVLIKSREVFPFTFVIMMGDNLYGSERPQDYVNKFEKPYKPCSTPTSRSTRRSAIMTIRTSASTNRST